MEFIKNNSDELYHYGIPGMKWGKRNYRSTSVSATLARRANKKVDSGFKKWKDEDAKKKNAINLGKKMNEAKTVYEKDKSNKQNKTDFKNSKKEYKKALSKNTTYRKGVVRQEVGRDAARKYLSEAKKIKKYMSNSSDPKLRKKYDDFMSKHDIERARARRAVSVSTARSRKIAGLKRAATITIGAAATSAAVGAGAYAVNKYLNRKGYSVSSDKIYNAIQNGKNILKNAKYLYF